MSLIVAYIWILDACSDFKSMSLNLSFVLFILKQHIKIVVMFEIIVTKKPPIVRIMSVKSGSNDFISERIDLESFSPKKNNLNLEKFTLFGS